MLTKTGAKLLDFGLAKLKGHGDRPVADTLVSAPTQSGPLTGEGTILGTLQYMAPEQLEGKPVDARTDLFAFGAIVYEMLTGHRAFEGESAASLIGAILERHPAPVSSLQPLTPPAVDRLVGKCLAKAPDDRWDTAHDVADELRWIGQTASAPVAIGETQRPTRRTVARWQLAGSAAVLLVIGAVAGGTLVPRWRSPASPPRVGVVRSELGVAPAESLAPFLAGRPRSTAVALSPDGRTLVFAGAQGDQVRLYRRSLDQHEAVPLAGTDGAQGPFFSPDGQWVGFWAHSQPTSSSLLKVPTGGGPAVPIGRFDSRVIPFGASWGDDGTIVFVDHQFALWRIPGNGGTPVRLPGPAPEETWHQPHVLPGSRAVLVQERPAGMAGFFDPDQSRVVAVELSTGARRTVVEGGADPRYLSTGHLLYAQWGQLYAAPFDLATLAVTGPAEMVLDGVMQAQNAGGNWLAETGAAQVALSASGTLAYVAGGPFPERRNERLVWRDRSGRREVLPAPPGQYGFPRLSPDGRRLVFRQLERGKGNIFVYDIARATTSRLTHRGAASYPLWTPDGRRIVMSYENEEGRGVAWIPADGSASPVWLSRSKSALSPQAWTPDGRTLVLLEMRADDRNNIQLLSVAEGSDAGPRPWGDGLAADSPNHGEPQLSPDGRWLAYVSARAVYVDSLATPGRRQQVSRDGARNPLWAPDGRELFYVDYSGPDHLRMMVVDVGASDELTLGVSRPLFEGEWVTNTRTSFDITPDGNRFLLVERDPQLQPPTPATRIHLILNWIEEVKAKVPTGR